MKLYEKARKMKKAFCFDICPFLSQEKCVHVWFEFFPNYLSRKKEPRKHFSASALPRPRKIFPWFLFPTSAKIGKNSNQTWTNFSRDKTGQISKQNTIFNASIDITFDFQKINWKLKNKKIKKNFYCFFSPNGNLFAFPSTQPLKNIAYNHSMYS